MDELGSGCTAHPGRDLQGSSPCTTEAQTRAARAQLPLSTQNLNLPNLTEVSPLGLCPGVTQRAGPPPSSLDEGQPGGRARVAPPSEAGGHPRTAALGAETTCPSAERSQGCARAEQSQDRQGGVTSGHGAGLPCSLPRVGWVFLLFFSSPFSISAVWKRRAELSPVSPAQTDP